MISELFNKSRQSIIHAIGNTPLVELRKIVPSGCGRIVAKLECANPTGSMKDRMAKSVISKAESRGWIKPGDTIVEYTGGTTGVSLAFVSAALGYRFHAVFSDAFSNEKRITMKAYGAEVTDILSDQKKINEKLIKAMIAKAHDLSTHEGTWWCDQLNNQDAEEGYFSMGDEIWEQTNGNIDAFVQMVGTAHSIHGVTKALQLKNRDLKVYAIEPTESAILSGRPTGSHKIEGVGIGFIPPLWQPELVDEIFTITTEEAMLMARRLAKEEGIFAGTSTGANVIVALRVAKQLGPDSTVAMIIIDSGLRYISTPLYGS